MIAPFAEARATTCTEEELMLETGPPGDVGVHCSLRRLVAVGVLISISLGGASLAGGASAKGRVATIGTAGSVIGISADGGRVATAVALANGAQTCDRIAVWQPAGNRITRIGAPTCRASSENDVNVDSLTLGGDRVAWAGYRHGNHAYCAGPFTASLASPEPTDLGVCDGELSDVFFDFAGDGSLLVVREYTQCEDNCEPDYVGTYQTDIALSRVTDTLVPIGPLKRDTRLLGVDAGRLLLSHGNTLEVVSPGQGKQAIFISLPGKVDVARLSGNDAVVASGRAVAAYNVSTGKPGVTRQLVAGGKLADVESGIALYTQAGNIHVLRLADGRDVVVSHALGLVAAQLEPSGLFFAYNIPKGGKKPGRVAFIPFTAVTALLGPVRH